MFSLIITIVSIALGVALVAASMYYGGDTLSEGRNRSEANGIVSAAQQISAALQISKALDATPATTVGDLVTNGHLSAAPTAKGVTGDFTITDGVVGATVASEGVCAAINTQAGVANDGTDGAPPTAAPTTAQYACAGAASPYTFTFK